MSTKKSYAFALFLAIKKMKTTITYAWKLNISQQGEAWNQTSALKSKKWTDDLRILQIFIGIVKMYAQVF